LEQLRFLENNIPMRVLLTDKTFIGVDQVEDVARVLPLLENQI
jgi:CMP-2-keto-3-deoxyoctulosonic acid synthetase